MEWEIYKGLNLGGRINTPPSKYQRREAEGLRAFLDKGLSDDLEDNEEEDEYEV